MHGLEIPAEEILLEEVHWYCKIVGVAVAAGVVDESPAEDILDVHVVGRIVDCAAVVAAAAVGNEPAAAVVDNIAADADFAVADDADFVVAAAAVASSYSLPPDSSSSLKPATPPHVSSSLLPAVVLFEPPAVPPVSEAPLAVVVPPLVSYAVPPFVAVAVVLPLLAFYAIRRPVALPDAVALPLRVFGVVPSRPLFSFPLLSFVSLILLLPFVFWPPPLVRFPLDLVKRKMSEEDHYY